MPLVKHTVDTGFTQYGNALPEVSDPTLGETLGASFRMENDVLNAIELFDRPAYPANPDFRPGPFLRDYDKQNGTQFWENYRDNFMGARSAEESAAIIGRINQERKDQDIADRAGWTGTVMQIAAGTLSPTLFLPFIGEARGLVAAGRGASWGLVGGVSQEALLAGNQETRTAGQSAFSLAASTVVGGILGGAVGVLRGGEMAALEKAFSPDMASTPNVPAIPSTVGAASSLVDPGGLAPGARTISKVLDSNPLTRNPVTFNLQGEDAYVRSVTAQLSDAGLGVESNSRGVPGAAGGTIENNIGWYNEKFSDGIAIYDQAYGEHVWDGAPPRWDFHGARTNLAARGSANKLSKKEFGEQVFLALNNNDTHTVPEVAKAAKALRETVYDPILKEAQRADVLPEGELDVKGAQTYVNRLYDTQVIRANSEEFISVLSKNFEQQLTERFQLEADKLAQRMAKDETLKGDLNRPADEVKALRDQFIKDIEEQKEMLPADDLAKEDQVALLRRQARMAKDETTKQDYLRQARDLKSTFSDAFKEGKGKISAARTRMSNLNRAASTLEARQAAKFEKIEQVEEQSLAALNRAVRAGQKTLLALDEVSDKALDAEVAKLVAQTDAAVETFVKNEERIMKMAEGELGDDPSSLFRADELQRGRANKLEDLSARLEEAGSLDRDALRQAINDNLQDTLAEIADVNARRGARVGKLWKQYEGLDPAQVKTRIESIDAKGASRLSDFLERQRLRGADDVDFANRTVDFKAYARQQAEEMKQKILGTTVRLPAVDVMIEERGAELARMLDISVDQIGKFLIRDPERLARSYIRTYAPDIELKKRFGTLNMGEIMQPMFDNMERRLKNVDGAVDKKGQPRSEEWKQKERLKIDAEYGLYKDNLNVLVSRLRHTRGLPDNPDGIAYRMAETVQNLNVLRLMGKVTVSSVADVSRPIMRYGLTRVFRDAFIPMITDWKNFKISLAEAKRMQGGLNPALQSRGRAMFDIMDDLQRGTKFERGVQFATARMGMIALFDYWTSAMKQFSGSVANVKIMDSLNLVVNGGAKKEVDNATRYLAQLGFGQAEVEKIWAQVQAAGGGAKVDGYWMPNTANWTDVDAQKLYHSAVSREADITIVTPGIDKPAWVDQNVAMRSISQFKSFSMASTYKTVAAGAQGLRQGDMAFVTGALISLAFGAFSYYLNAIITGGETEKKMRAATPGQWADEAIDRAGLTGILSEVQRVGQNIPGVSPYLSFGGRGTTRAQGNSLVEQVLGPTFDFAKTAADAITGLHDPTRATGHAIRTLMPLQNTIGLSRIFDLIEAAVNLPEKRT